MNDNILLLPDGKQRRKYKQVWESRVQRVRRGRRVQRVWREWRVGRVLRVQRVGRVWREYWECREYGEYAEYCSYQGTWKILIILMLQSTVHVIFPSWARTIYSKNLLLYEHVAQHRMTVHCVHCCATEHLRSDKYNKKPLLHFETSESPFYNNAGICFSSSQYSSICLHMPSQYICVISENMTCGSETAPVTMSVDECS